MVDEVFRRDELDPGRGYTYKETAKYLGCSLSSIEKDLKKGKLKRALDEDGKPMMGGANGKEKLIYGWGILKFQADRNNNLFYFINLKLRKLE